MIDLLSCKQPAQTKLFYAIRTNSGVEATMTAYGARLVSLTVPNKNRRPTNVVLGFNSDSAYAYSTEHYFGATIGRYGNRIAKGRFTLKGKDYQITINDSLNTLHGGTHGFQSKDWTASQTDGQTIVFTYLSKDGEEGFPGNHNVKVTYTLTDSNQNSI